MRTDLPSRKRQLGRRTFAERTCAHYQRPLSDFPIVAWQVGAAWPTRWLRPAILYFTPRYFEAEDFYLERAADCRWRSEVVEEMALMEGSYLRRGAWRYLGFGISGSMILRFYDHLIAATYQESETLEPRPATVSRRASQSLETPSLNSS